MISRQTLAALICLASLSPVLAQQTQPNQAVSPPNAERDDSRLRQLEELLHDPERFRRPGFRLLWAREAYRSGNLEGAITEWRSLAAEGNETAAYVLELLAPGR